MKKLKLNLENVEEVLSREQLKHIIGGDGSGSGGPTCEDSCGGSLPACGPDLSCMTVDCGVGERDQTVKKCMPG